MPKIPQDDSGKIEPDGQRESFMYHVVDGELRVEGLVVPGVTAMSITVDPEPVDTKDGLYRFSRRQRRWLQFYKYYWSREPVRLANRVIEA